MLHEGPTCFPVRSESLLSRPDLALPKPRRAAEGIGRSGATRSHAQHALAREHGEDGEHRTFPGVSTVAHFRRSRDRTLSFMRDVTELVPHLPCQENGAMPARASLPRRPHDLAQALKRIVLDRPTIGSCAVRSAVSPVLAGAAYRCILSSHENPKICRIDDAEVVGDLIAVDMPIPRHLLA